MEVNFGARCWARAQALRATEWPDLPVGGGVLSLIPWLVASKQNSKDCILYVLSILMV